MKENEKEVKDFIKKWNGEVIVCCQDLLGELKVGDVKKDTLLSSQTSQDFRHYTEFEKIKFFKF
jgi:hypothetical protein